MKETPNTRDPVDVHIVCAQKALASAAYWEKMGRRDLADQYRKWASMSYKSANIHMEAPTWD